jgi:hypothetical protein
MIIKAIKNKIARKDYKMLKKLMILHNIKKKVRDKRKEYTGIITTQGTTQQAKDAA